MSAPAITETNVEAVAPELTVKLSSQAWVVLLAWVNELDLSSLCESDATTTLLRIYLAAHLGSLMSRAASGAAGPVTGEAAGGVRRSFGLLPLGDAVWFGSTFYGQSYLAILSMTFAHGPFAV